MNLVKTHLKDLIKPNQFKFISEDGLFDRLVFSVNNKLKNAIKNKEEIFVTSEAHVEVILNANDDYSENVTLEMVAALKNLYQLIGWNDITYEHREETEENYKIHKFKFYFNTQTPASPGYPCTSPE